MPPPAPSPARTTPAPAAVFLLPPRAWPLSSSLPLTLVVPPRKLASPAPAPTPTRPATLAVPLLLSPPVAALFPRVPSVIVVVLGPIPAPPTPELAAPPRAVPTRITA